jgi:WD40 repeat protein
MNEDGNIIATASSDKFIRLFDTRVSLKKKISKLRGHQDNIRNILLTKDGKTVEKIFFLKFRLFLEEVTI